MNKVTKWLFIICLFFSSCSYSHNDYFNSNFDRIPLTVKIISDYSETEERSTIAAIDFWNKIGVEAFSYSPDIENADVTIQLHVLEIPEGDFNAYDSNHYQNKCTIIVRQNYGAYFLIAHELGHCLGFSHNEEENSIMNPHPSLDSIITNSMEEILLSYISSLNNK